MRVLHVSDLHGHQPWFDWLAADAPKHDLLALAGDLQHENNEAQTNWIRDGLGRLAQRIAVCSGNHDTAALIAELKGRPNTYVDLFNGQIGDIWLTVVPMHWEGDHDIHRQVLAMLREAAAKKQRAMPWVLLHHRPPAGVLGETGMVMSDPGLNRWMERFAIRYALCGHDHDQPAITERCFEAVGLGFAFNPGRTEGAAVPNYILFDTKAAAGIWHHSGRFVPFSL